MAPPLAVAADVPPAASPRRAQTDPTIAFPGRSCLPPIRAQRRLMSASQADRQHIAPVLASWLRSSPSERNLPTDISPPTSSPPLTERRTGTPATSTARTVKRPSLRFRSYSWRENTERRSDALMARSVSLAGASHMTRSSSSPGTAETHPLTPTTSVLSASPTTPDTPSIPSTPPRLAVSQSISSPSLFQYGAFSYNGVVYSTPHHPSPVTHHRASTWSSVDSSYSYSPISSKLPIGQRGSPWAAPEPTTTVTPVDFADESESDYDRFDEESDEEEYPETPWPHQIDDSPSLPYSTSPESSPRLLPVSPNASPRLYERPPRTPSGPRPMADAPATTINGSAGLGLAAATTSESSLSIYSEDSAPRDFDLARRERRRGIDFMSNPRFSTAFSLSSVDSSRFDELVDRVESTAETSQQHEREASNGTIMEEDYSWEAEECNISGEVTNENTLEDVINRRTSISPTRSTQSRSSDPHREAQMTRKRSSSVKESTEGGIFEGGSHTLERAFTVDSSHSQEISAFSDDDDDEDPSKPKRHRLHLKRLSKAMRSSVSLHNFKARHSYVPPRPSSPESPESVASLRARQGTDSSLAIDHRITKLASVDPVLSPIPASPSEPALNMQTNAVASPSQSAPAAQHAPLSAPTRASIAETSIPTGSFFKHFIPRARKVSTPSKPKPNSSPASRPPNIPLPPVPSTPPPLPPQNAPRAVRPPRRRPPPPPLDEQSLGMDVICISGDQHLTVVDPDSSMARLEESIAKLETYAPHASVAGTVDMKKAEVGAAVKLTGATYGGGSISDRTPKPSRGVSVERPEEKKDDREKDKEKSVGEKLGDVPRGRVSGLGPDVVVYTVATPRYDHFSQYSLATAETSASGSSTSIGSGPSVPFVVEVKASGPLLVGGNFGSIDKTKKALPPPSLSLLPKFDFEDAPKGPLDFFGLPLRSDSLAADKRANLAVYTETVSAGTDVDVEENVPSPSESAPSLPGLEEPPVPPTPVSSRVYLPATPFPTPILASALELTEEPRPAPPPRPPRRRPPPRQQRPRDSRAPRRPAPPPSPHLDELDDTPPSGVPSFMHFSPSPAPHEREKEREVRSRVRRLLNKVNVRDEFMRGLRGSLVPLSTGYVPVA